MKTSKPLNLIAKSLFAIVLLSQLAACNFMATATSAVGDSQSTAGAGAYDTDVAAIDAGTGANSVSRSAINKTLGWTAPVTREDASAISMAEIAGFRVYYGAKQGEYKQYVEINDAYIDELDLNTFELEADTYYIVITTIDTNGRESTFSEEVVIQA